MIQEKNKYDKFSDALMEAFMEAHEDGLKPYEVIGLIEVQKLVAWSACNFQFGKDDTTKSFTKEEE